MSRAAAWPLLALLAACGEDADRAGLAANAQQASALAEREVPAEALPSDEALASALDGEIHDSVWNPPEGVIVEPDGMRFVVRNARCAFQAGSRSRAVCTYEYHRSPAHRDHEAAAKWVSWLKDWQAATRRFDHVRPARGDGTAPAHWRVEPRPQPDSVNLPTAAAPGRGE